MNTGVAKAFIQGGKIITESVPSKPRVKVTDISSIFCMPGSLHDEDGPCPNPPAEIYSVRIKQIKEWYRRNNPNEKGDLARSLEQILIHLPNHERPFDNAQLAIKRQQGQQWITEFITNPGELNLKSNNELFLKLDKTALDLISQHDSNFKDDHALVIYLTAHGSDGKSEVIKGSLESLHTRN